ncbi:hypothetical protein [Nostoc sp.]|uniref:hypothetical protein n=1 Tax=Nostoc sp. TaxID=1180 RepID=UPI002FF893D3
MKRSPYSPSPKETLRERASYGRRWQSDRYQFITIYCKSILPVCKIILELDQ